MDSENNMLFSEVCGIQEDIVIFVEGNRSLKKQNSLLKSLIHDKDTIIHSLQNKLAILQNYHHIVDNHNHAPSPLAAIAPEPTDINLSVFEFVLALDTHTPMKLVTACTSTYVPITIPHVVYHIFAQLHGFFEKHTTAFSSCMLHSMGLTSGVIGRNSQSIVSSIPHVKWNSHHDI
ncbi:hypothetical protein KI387_038421, partial [Taxus chinensis]